MDGWVGGWVGRDELPGIRFQASDRDCPRLPSLGLSGSVMIPGPPGPGPAWARTAKSAGSPSDSPGFETLLPREWVPNRAFQPHADLTGRAFSPPAAGPGPC